MEPEEKQQFLKHVGERVRTYRESQGLSRERLAELVNITTQYVSDIEQGRKCMSLAIFVELARVFEVSLDTLGRGRTAGDPAVDRVAEKLLYYTPLDRDLIADILCKTADTVRQLGREE